MGLDSVLRNGVKTINNVTKSAQVNITIHRWMGQTYDGTPTYAAPLATKAVVEYKSEARQSSTGQLRVARTYLIITSPLSALGVANRSEPLDDRDLITLPTMHTGPIIETYGVVDPATDLPYCHEVWMGDRRGDN
jgi:hypothetical protein